MLAFTANLSVKTNLDIGKILDKIDKTLLDSFQAVQNLQREFLLFLEECISFITKPCDE